MSCSEHRNNFERSLALRQQEIGVHFLVISKGTYPRIVTSPTREKSTDAGTADQGD